MISAERHGPWAVIAGGSEGLGECFARRFAAVGVNLVLIARGQERLNALAETLRADFNVEVVTLALDLTSNDAIEQVISLTRGLEVGALIVNAGAGEAPVELVQQPPEETLRTIQLNVVIYTRLAQHFARGMQERRRGAILFVGSLGSVAGSKKLVAYTASKAYIQSLAEGLWAELEPHNVDVAVLMIGRTRTPALERSSYGTETDMPAAEPDDVVNFAIENLQNGPVIVPPELKQAFDALRSMPRDKAVRAMTRSLDSQTTE